MRIEVIGRQGDAEYGWRVFGDGARVLYYRLPEHDKTIHWRPVAY